MATLHSTIYALCEKRGDATGFQLQKDDGGYRTVSWKKFRSESLKISAMLHSAGIKQGDRVLILSENTPEWGMIALAVMNLGAILVPLASVASPIEVQNICKGASPKYCFLSKRVSAFFQIEAEIKSHNIHCFTFDAQSEHPFSEIPEQEKSVVGLEIKESATAILIYTSGTTGNPKGVPISHQNILVNAQDVLTVIEASEKDRIVSVLPLSHMLEFTGGFVVASLAGAKITYAKSLKAEDLIKALYDTKATIMIAVPLLFEIIARNLQSKIDDAPAILRSIFQFFSRLTYASPALGPILFFPIHRALGGNIRYLVAGGSKLQPATFDFFKGLGITLLQGYGLTETSPVLTITNLSNAAPDHVGKAMPSLELGIFSDQGAQVQTGQEGEIWARGPSVFSGYLDPDHNKGVFFGEWFRTGDLGNLDANGFLRITGRKKDLIVTPAGKNVYPEEIEILVLGSGKFLEVCVLGIQDGAGHEKICLVLVPDRSKFIGKANAEITKEASALALELCRTLSEYKWPQKVEVLYEELPKTSTRKIKKHEVRKKLLEKATPQTEAYTNAGGLDLSDDLEKTIAQGIFNITKIEPAKIRISDSLTKEIGLDSLTFVELVSHVEKKFGTQIEGIDFATIQTVEDLVKALEFAAGTRKKKRKVFFVEFAPDDNKKIHWRIPRRFFNILLRFYLNIAHGLKVEGLENLKSGGPFIFTPNHSSHFDMISIIGSEPTEMLHKSFAVGAKDYFFNKSWKAYLVRVLMNAMPFDRKGRVDESMNRCREALAAGGSLTIFPEGTRSPDGRLQPFKQGVGQLLAAHPKALAVPVFIDGAFAIMPKGSKFPGAGNLTIRYGKPISFRDLPSEADSYKKIAERLREEVVALSSGKLR